MKTYLSIPGPSKAPRQECVAFYKYDGSNIRAEWQRKTGWCKFGTRKRLLDTSDPDFGTAIPCFMETYADDLAKVFTNNKAFRGVQRATVYMEYFGETTFSGYYDPVEPRELMLIDVCIYKKGYVLPSDFVKHFGHLKSAEVVYRGNLNESLIYNVRNGQYNVKEGVVCKGVIMGKKKSPQHGLWMTKIKTKWWMETLKSRAKTDEVFRQALRENVGEQGF